MKTVRAALVQMFTAPSAHPVHWVCGSIAAVVTWSFFGTIHNVMHFGAYVTMLFWLGLSDFGGCFYRHFWPNLKETHPAKNSEKSAEIPAADKDEMGRAA